MVDPRVKAAAEAMMIRSQAGSLSPIPWDILAQVALNAANEVAWLPIEAHPEDGQEVLVFTIDKIIMTDTFHCDEVNGWFEITDDGDVTHWMPLPQPPECKA